MAEYETDITGMGRDELLRELIYHSQRVAYHAIRMEERYMLESKVGLHEDYRFVWMGEEIRYIAKLHERLAVLAKDEQMRTVRAIIKAEDEAEAERLAKEVI